MPNCYYYPLFHDQVVLQKNNRRINSRGYAQNRAHRGGHQVKLNTEENKLQANLSQLRGGSGGGPGVNNLEQRVEAKIALEK